ncbi:MAG: ATP-binding cassette domain-containing protein, partial [Pseudolabrys sp.]
QLVVRDIGISFGGIKAASEVNFTAQPGAVTTLIGPNGAGKTTVLNMIGGFYRPDVGSIRIGETEMAGAPAWRIARAGIARTYQTTQLFGAMSVLDNILVALRHGKLGNPLRSIATVEARRAAPKLCLCSPDIADRSQRLPATCRMWTGISSRSHGRSRRVLKSSYWTNQRQA